MQKKMNFITINDIHITTIEIKIARLDIRLVTVILVTGCKEVFFLAVLNSQVCSWH